MDSALAATASALDIKTLLARINQRITLLRAWLSHDHNDETYWWARRTTAPRAQREREVLRQVANVLHVEGAANRGRVHGTRFETLDVQWTWLEEHAERICPTAAEFAQLPSYATLALLREGKLPLLSALHSW